MANHYIRDGGSGDGSDWTNAWDDLPSTLVRGDTYYIADGTYTGYIFDDADSGIDVITINKATIASHGTETGWLDSYGDGTAYFTVADGNVYLISANYITVNGQSGSLDGVFGIELHQQNYGGKVVRVSPGVHDISMSYVNMRGKGYSSSTSGSDVLYMVDTGSNPIYNCSFYRCWFHNNCRTAIFPYNVYGCTWNGCWITENIGMDVYGIHGEGIAPTNIYSGRTPNVVKNSVFRNIEGSAWIGFMGNAAAVVYDFEIYSNLFYIDSNHILDGWDGISTEPTVTDFTGTNGIIATVNDITIGNIKIYGNTFANLQQNTVVSYWTDPHTNCETINNLFIHPTYTGTFDGDTVLTNTSTNSITLVVNYATNDLRLSSATAAGTSLASPYNMDIGSITRGGDGIWDRGAYEYDSGATAPKDKYVMIFH